MNGWILRIEIDRFVDLSESFPQAEFHFLIYIFYFLIKPVSSVRRKQSLTLLLSLTN